jgi:hypothetical protein
MEEDNAAAEARRAAKEIEQGNDMSCVICYMPFEEDYDNITMRACEHIFHKECLAEYVKTSIVDMKQKVLCPEASCGKDVH